MPLRSLLAALCVLVAGSMGGGSTGVAAHPLTAQARTTTPAPTPKSQIPYPFVSGAAGSYAWGAATMPDGSVIIGDIWNRRVLHYDTGGALLGTLISMSGGDAPYGLAVDPRNLTIYVGRQFPAGVERWVPGGTGGRYTMAGLLHANGMGYPSRVAVADDGTVYIADELAHTVWVFNGDTHQFMFNFGSHGSAPGQFYFPRALAFDSLQRLFVMDCGNERVQVFDKSGKLLYSFGSNGSGQGQFHGINTRGLAIDRSMGWIFIVDVGANTVHKFDLSGNFIAEIGHGDTSTFPSPLGTFTQGGREAAVDGSHHLWVGDMPNFRAQVFDDSTGQPLFMRPDPVQLPANGAFNDPRGLTIDGQGSLYVADTHNFRLEKFDPSGNFAWTVGNRGGGTGSDTFNYSRNMSADLRDNTVYLADTYNFSIDKYDTAGNRLWQVKAAGPATFNHPSGVGVGPDDHDVYVADSINRRIVVLEPTAGGFLRMFNCAPCGNPRGVAVDQGSGDIYVADISADLLHFNNAGKFLGTIAGKGAATNQLLSAADVVLDSNFIYVADSNAAMVKIWNKADGSFAGAFGGPGTMHLPSAVAVNPVTGYVYVTEEYGDRVSIWCVTGC